MKCNLFVISACKLPTYLMCLLLIGTLCLYTTEFASTQVLDPDLVLYFDYEDFDGDTVIEKSRKRLQWSD